jgi:hypothetical protein
MKPGARRAATGAVILLILLATFAWYFRGDVVFDLTRLWSACF